MKAESRVTIVGSSQETLRKSWESSLFTEEILSFEGDRGARLYGILTSPHKEVKGILLLLNTGLNYRIAWHRLNLKIARYMAERGFASFRFDTHGVGDSWGDVHETMDIIRHFDIIQSGAFLFDAEMALSLIRHRFPGKEVIPVGLCGGAVTGIGIAGKDRGIARAVMICGPATLSKPADLREVRPWNAPIILSAYMKKVFNLRAWWNFITLRSDYRLIFDSVRVFLKERWKKLKISLSPPKKRMVEAVGAVQSPSSNPPEIKGEESILNPLYISSLHKFLKKGGEVFLVFAEHDRATHEFLELRDHYLPENSPFIDQVRIHTVRGANHAFHSDEAQVELMESLSSWLSRSERGGNNR